MRVALGMSARRFSMAANFSSSRMNASRSDARYRWTKRSMNAILIVSFRPHRAGSRF